MENPLKLVQFTAQSFAGIDKSSPVIICFPQGYGGYVALVGDQATHKSSTLEAFKAASGLPFPANAVNRKDNDRKLKFEFERGDKKYRVGVSKTRFELELLIDEEKLKWASVGSPKAMVADLLGPIGISPMFLKESKGKEQIDWLKNFFRLDADAIEMEAEIELNLKNTYKARREVKRDLKRVDSQLEYNPYYRNRQEWEQKLAPQEAEGGAEAKIKNVQQRFSQYNTAIEKVSNHKANKQTLNDRATRIDEEIAELHRQIQLKAEEKIAILNQVEEIDTKINTGEAWIQENEGVVQENENIANLIKEQQELATHKANFAQMDELEKSSRHLHDEYIRLENRLDGYRKTKKELIKAFTPEIEGLEVCIPDGAEIDEDEQDADKKPETREGIFYNGCSPLELSESELWGLYSELLKVLNIKIIVIENINSLGSKAIELFDSFIEAGGYVLASEMKRAEKNLKVIVQNKIIESIEEEQE